jgi:hypothetical protein
VTVPAVTSGDPDGGASTPAGKPCSPLPTCRGSARAQRVGLGLLPGRGRPCLYECSAKDHPTTVRRFARAAGLDELLVKAVNRASLLDGYTQHLTTRYGDGVTTPPSCTPS